MRIIQNSLLVILVLYISATVSAAGSHTDSSATFDVADRGATASINVSFKEALDTAYPQRLSSKNEREIRRLCNGDLPPPHSQKQLDELARWTAGSAFLQFAPRAGIQFDRIRYNEDCPNRGILNFAQTLGSKIFACIGTDPFVNPISLSMVFYRRWAKDPADFHQYYMKMANQYGMLRYISKDAQFLD